MQKSWIDRARANPAAAAALAVFVIALATLCLSLIHISFRLRRGSLRSLRERRLVPVEGIEPPLLAEHDFESCASTSSATRAFGAFYIFGWRWRPSHGAASTPLVPATRLRSDRELRPV